MAQDRSVLVRFHPDSIALPQEYLCQTPGGAWVWSPAKVDAYVFDRHSEAADAAQKHEYEAKWDPGKKHRPWAVVLSCEDVFVREKRAREKRHRDREESAEASVRRLNLPPSQVYAMTAQRMGEGGE